MKGLARLLRFVWNGVLAGAGTAIGSVLGLGVTRGWIYFPFLSDFLGRLPFSAGWKLRRHIYGRILPHVGREVVLHPGTVFEDSRTAIGHDVWISGNCYVDFAIIEDHVLIGPHVVILAGGHHHRSARLDMPIKLQGNDPKAPVTIGRGCWIGANATVMADIGSDAIVGAGSVVTKPVPPLAVVAGNPARLLRMRDGKAAMASGAPTPHADTADDADNT